MRQFITESVREEILLRHKQWLNGKKDGKRANFSGVDLSTHDLSNACFSKAILNNVDLSWAYLRKVKFDQATIKKADLSNADLRGADFYGANLKETNLSGADLRGADLRRAIGNGKEIQTVQADDYHVNITDRTVWINDCSYPWEIWLKLNDSQFIGALQGGRCISSIDHIMKEKALNWWHQWKPELSRIIEERKQQREAVNTDGSIALVPGI